MSSDIPWEKKKKSGAEVVTKFRPFKVYINGPDLVQKHFHIVQYI